MNSTGYQYVTKPEVQELVNLVNSNSLINKQLSAICQVNGLKSSGVKADLQQRIVELIKQAADNPSRFEEVRMSISKAQGGGGVRGGSAGAWPQQNHRVQHGQYSPHPPVTPQPSVHNTTSSPHGSMPPYPAYQFGAATPASNSHPIPAAINHHSPTLPPMPQYSSSFTFRPSPFYTPEALMSPVKPCEIMSQHRHSVNITLKAQDSQLLQQCSTDPTMRVMILCAAGNTGVQDISFPFQSEIKVNGGEVKANTRGLKNKPGSTRPVDITEVLRLRPTTYGNTIEFTYALTTKGGEPRPNQVRRQRFFLCVYACKRHSVAALVAKLNSGNKISKTSVVQEITRKAQDTEIVTTSQNLSLKCPLSYMRLGLPVRSVACKHIQCFDATSYLQLQEQGPQWICPICSQPAPFDKLAVDEYAKEILACTEQSVEQVTIEPDGAWRVPGTATVELKDDEENEASYVDDDDLIISDISYLNGRSTATPNRPSLPAPVTPSSGVSREGSSMPRSGAGTKRPAEVVDLTLSDDDDDGPSLHPPAKRLNTGHHNGYY